MRTENCGKDVCEVLGYTKTDKAIREHIANLDVQKRYIKVCWSTRGYIERKGDDNNINDSFVKLIYKRWS